tara:strand:- start:5390 stop:7534 length:2145 start_codon:yes stop_codon:yes gene_type:complete
MGKKSLIIALIVLSFGFVSSAVYINDFDPNPPGADSPNEWVELYNDGAPVDLTGYNLTKGDFEVIQLAGIINRHIVFNWTPGGLDNVDENITLTNTLGIAIDMTPHVDDADETRSWARLSDGFDTDSDTDWALKTRTFNSSNDFTPPTINTQDFDPNVPFYTDGISLTANITDDFRIDSVWVEANWTGAFLNYSFATNVSNNYTYNITDPLTDGQIFSWRFHANDSSNNTVQGALQTTVLLTRTSVAVSPAAPDGLNGWYVTNPLFTLTANSSASQIFYRWGASADQLYTVPFYLILNGTLGGIETLTYYSVAAGRTETEQEVTIYGDETVPMFENLVPANRSDIETTLRPTISVRVDELYQQNSGIDLASIILTVNGVGVVPIITQDGLDVNVTYYPPADLPLGQNDITIYAEDNAGHGALFEWSFDIDPLTPLAMTINSPVEQNYSTGRVEIDIQLQNGDGDIEYYDWQDSRPRWKRFCRNCDSFDRAKNFRRGLHELTIRAIDSAGQYVEENVSFAIDTKEPRVSRVLPRSRAIVNGSEFYVRYSEDNLMGVELHYGNSEMGFRSETLLTCSSGRNQECSVDVDLSDYHGQYITYWFEITDVLRTVSSRVFNISIDVSNPQVIVNMPLSATYGRRVDFNVSVNEVVKTIEYYDADENKPRWRRLASNKDGYGEDRVRKKSFRGYGQHDLTVRAIDYAGNVGQQNVIITISS